MNLEGRTVVVAGNGMSLSRINAGRVLTDDVIFRTNNFFFEPDYYLGRRVDLAFMGGDPRVAPFMFETLYQCRQDYDLGLWSANNPKVREHGKRRFAGRFIPMQFRDDEIRNAVDGLVQRYQRKLMTGTHAVLMAHALGAEKIILAGMDLYSSGQRYPFIPGPHFRTLMDPSVNPDGVDEPLHAVDLDKTIFEILAKRSDVELLRSADGVVLDDVIDLAPFRDGEALTTSPRANAPTDWADRCGIYHISTLKLLRRGSALRRKLK